MSTTKATFPNSDADQSGNCKSNHTRGHRPQRSEDRKSKRSRGRRSESDISQPRHLPKHQRPPKPEFYEEPWSSSSPEYSLRKDEPTQQTSALPRLLSPTLPLGLEDEFRGRGLLKDSEPLPSSDLERHLESKSPPEPKSSEAKSPGREPSPGEVTQPTLPLSEMATPDPQPQEAAESPAKITWPHSEADPETLAHSENDGRCSLEQPEEGETRRSRRAKASSV